MDSVALALLAIHLQNSLLKTVRCHAMTKEQIPWQVMEELPDCLGLTVDLFENQPGGKVRLDFTFDNDDYAKLFEEAQPPEALTPPL